MSELIIPIKQYARTAAQLASDNPILVLRQLVIESDTGKMKLGNGTTAYNSLPYLLVNGNTSQYVRGDGSLATFPSIPSITGLVPYTGANANVNLGTFDLTADVITGATGSYTSSGNGNTLGVTHSSGSGIALNITKGGNGEGLYINKTSGSGNAATIIGTLNATTLVKSGGTSSQFLKADGSIDSTVYYPNSNPSGFITSAALSGYIQGSGTTNYIPKFTASGTIGNSLAFDNGTFFGINNATTFDNNYVLQVGGRGYFRTNTATPNDLLIENTNAGLGANSSISLLNQSGKILQIVNDNGSIGAYIGTNSNHQFSIRSNSVPRMFFATNGVISAGVLSSFANFNISNSTYGGTFNLLSLATLDGTYNPRTVISLTTAIGQPALVRFDSTFSSGWGATNYAFPTGNFAIGSTTLTSMFNVGTSAQFQVTSSGEVAIGTTINAAAILTLTSTTKGVLFPRMTTTQKNAIVSPVAGLMVYDTTLNKLSIRTASSWETVTSA
jgi:hypothetical protein